jgi:prephenate dehydratase
MEVTVGYLGPEGTFTEEALFTQKDLRNSKLVPFSSITDVIDAVHQKRITIGFVPMENSIEGSVLETLDQLVFFADVLIQREVVIDIHLYLMAKAKMNLNEIKEIYTYPLASRQCTQWLNKNIKSASIIATNSSAEAARIISALPTKNVAAVAPKIAAKLYKLQIIAQAIEDHPQNQTRFVALSADRVAAPSGRDKTTIVCFQHQDRPGSLHAILGEFAARGINLTKLESRPTKEGLGQYCFVIDMEGHIADPVIADCLKTLKAELADVKFLGSYPSSSPLHDKKKAQLVKQWKEADKWLSTYLSKIENH